MQMLFQVQLENDLFTLFEKKWLDALLTVKRFNNLFSGFLFSASDFILFIFYSESEIKF